MTALLSRWYLPAQEKAWLSLQVFVKGRLFISVLGGITDEVFFSLGIGNRTVCILEKLQVMLSVEDDVKGQCLVYGKGRESEKCKLRLVIM